MQDDDDDTCEEWERHESLHEDITSQGRTKERLFEEEIELKWEKGGSGLVFYTDAAFWDAQEGGMESIFKLKLFEQGSTLTSTQDTWAPKI